jgi:outer membrane protein, heavy metal efflux system
MKLKLMIAMVCVSNALTAQTQSPLHPPPSGQQTLVQLYEASWQLQAEYTTQSSQQAALTAKLEVTKRRLPEAGTIDLSTSRGQFGGRGNDISYSTPLWLKNEQRLSANIVSSDRELLASKLALAQLRTAASVREAYWAWFGLSSEIAFLSNTNDAALLLLDDVKKRTAAGDMSRADLLQAQLAQAASLSALEDVRLAEQSARIRLSGLTGMELSPTGVSAPIAESVPAQISRDVNPFDQHPVLKDFLVRIAQLKVAQQLAIVQSQSRSELTVGLSRDRGATGDANQTSIRIGYKMPLNSSGTQRIANLTTQSQIDELSAQLQIERARLSTEQSLAERKNKSLLAQIELAQQRVTLSRSLQAMVQKAFSMGEADLPTRIKTQIEANEAQRTLSRLQWEQAAAASNLKQVLGILPNTH